MLDFDIVFCYLESDFRGWHPSNMRLDCLDFFTHMCGNCCSIFKIQFLHQTINYLQSIKEHNYLEKTNRYITTTSSLPQFQRMCPTYIFKTFNRRQLFVLIILFIIINNGGSEKGWSISFKTPFRADSNELLFVSEALILIEILVDYDHIWSSMSIVPHLWLANIPYHKKG